MDKRWVGQRVALGEQAVSKRHLGDKVKQTKKCGFGTEGGDTVSKKWMGWTGLGWD